MYGISYEISNGYKNRVAFIWRRIYQAEQTYTNPEAIHKFDDNQNYLPAHPSTHNEMGWIECRTVSNTKNVALRAGFNQNAVLYSCFCQCIYAIHNFPSPIRSTIYLCMVNSGTYRLYHAKIAQSAKVFWFVKTNLMKYLCIKIVQNQGH